MLVVVNHLHLFFSYLSQLFFDILIISKFRWQGNLTWLHRGWQRSQSFERFKISRWQSRFLPWLSWLSAVSTCLLSTRISISEVNLWLVWISSNHVLSRTARLDAPPVPWIASIIDNIIACRISYVFRAWSLIWRMRKSSCMNLITASLMKIVFINIGDSPIIWILKRLVLSCFNRLPFVPKHAIFSNHWATDQFSTTRCRFTEFFRECIMLWEKRRFCTFHLLVLPILYCL